MKSVHITETKVLLLDVSTTTLSPSIWHHGVSTHDWIKVSTAGALYYYIESQYLTTEVSTYPSGQVSTARGQYNYIESKYLTHEVSTHHWGQVSTARGQYYYIELNYLTHEVSTHQWGQVFSARGQYYYFKSKYLRPSFYCKRLVLLHLVPIADKMMSVHINEAKSLLLEVSTTTLSPSIWHLKSVHISEDKVYC